MLKEMWACVSEKNAEDWVKKGLLASNDYEVKKCSCMYIIYLIKKKKCVLVICKQFLFLLKNVSDNR